MKKQTLMFDGAGLTLADLFEVEIHLIPKLIPRQARKASSATSLPQAPTPGAAQLLEQLAATNEREFTLEEIRAISWKKGRNNKMATGQRLRKLLESGCLKQSGDKYLLL